jgi:NAD(P)H-hydrate epimerase
VTGIGFDDLPALTAEQMREVDRIMTEDLGIELGRMMENAGAGLARLIRERYRPATATILAGSGGNGGGGLVAARHLANRGTAVFVTTSRSLDQMAPETRAQGEIALRMGIPFAEKPRPADVVMDALVGYSLVGNPRGATADLVRWANEQKAPTISLDIPTGLDATTGEVADPCVIADATLTLALPKAGLLGAGWVTGDVYLADLSVPSRVYAELGLDVDDPFQDGPLIRLA